MAVGTEAEVLDSLTGVLGATEDQGVASSGGTESKLVQGDSLTTSSEDAGTGGGGESQGSDGHLGALEQTVVIGDGTDNNDGSLLTLLVDVGDNAGQGDGRSVDLGCKQTSKNNLVERGIGSASQEAVKLHQELEVDIVALGGSAVSALDVVAVEIDTHCGGCRCEIWRCWVWRWMRRTALSFTFRKAFAHWWVLQIWCGRRAVVDGS